MADTVETAAAPGSGVPAAGDAPEPVVFVVAGLVAAVGGFVVGVGPMVTGAAEAEAAAGVGAAAPADESVGGTVSATPGVGVVVTLGVEAVGRRLGGGRK